MLLNVFSNLQPYGEQNEPVSGSIACIVAQYNATVSEGVFKAVLDQPCRSEHWHPKTVLECLNVTLKAAVLPLIWPQRKWVWSRELAEEKESLWFAAAVSCTTALASPPAARAKAVKDHRKVQGRA